MRHLIFRITARGFDVRPLYTNLDESAVRAEIADAGGVIIAEPNLDSREVWSVVDELRRRPPPINVVASWG